MNMPARALRDDATAVEISAQRAIERWRCAPPGCDVFAVALRAA